MWIFEVIKIRLFPLALVFLIGGCTAMTLPVFTPKTITAYPHSKISEGLMVAVNPMTDEAEIEKYFGTDLLSEGILPVLVIANNTNPSSSFVLRQENFSLFEKDSGQEIVQGGKMQESAAADAIGNTGAVLLAMPLLILAGKMGADAIVVQHNFETKRFHSKTLSPGKENYGFVYFPISSKENLQSKAWVFSLKALGLNGVNNQEFNFTFNSLK